MQIKIFTIPVMGGEKLNDDLNLFLRSKKILQTESRLVESGSEAYWCFCIRYLDDKAVDQPDRNTIDYKEVLDEASFKRYAELRKIRKRIFTEEGIPAFAVFTNEELAAMAAVEDLTAESLSSLKGIGEKKIEKYGHHFLQKPVDEKSENAD